MAIVIRGQRVRIECGRCRRLAKTGAAGSAAVALAAAVDRAIRDGWALTERSDLCPRCRPPAPSPTIPTAEQLAYCRERIDARRRQALAGLVTAEHVEQVATMVFGFYPDDPEGAPTAEDVAYRILAYLVDRVVEPLMAEPSLAPAPDAPSTLSGAEGR